MLARKYITQDRLKKKTLADIFLLILESKQATRRQIEYETGFSWGTVSANAALLLEKGYILERKCAQSGAAGRSTYTLCPAPDPFVSIGLDINCTGLSCEIVSLDATVKHLLAAPFTAVTQAEVLRQADSLFQAALDWCNREGLRVFSVGIAMQGSVDGRAGLSLRFPRIADWQICNIKEYFTKKYGFPVYLAHDPKCMLLGEMSRQPVDNCVLVRLDDGIGLAVSLDGRIMDDTQRLELGHTIAVPEGAACGCGSRGCLEAYAAIPAIARSANTSAEQLFNDPHRFRSHLEAAGKHLSVALFNTVKLFHPQKLILTGKAAALEPFVQSAVSLVRGRELDIHVDPGISAAYGVAVEAMKSAVKAYHI